MKKNTRINLILNAKRDTARVLANYRKLFESEDRILFYTHEEESVLKKLLSDTLGISEEQYGKVAFYSKFNDYDPNEISDEHRLIFLKMPNSLFHNISKALNDALKFVDTTGCARFVHFFADDYRINGDAKYDPQITEDYMDRFSEPFVMDGKTNLQNYAFAKMSPRFVFVTELLKEPVSFYQFEGHDHFVIDRDNCKLNFDEKVVRMYIIEYVLHCHKEGKIHNLTFYTDPVLSPLLTRDDTFDPSVITPEDQEQIGKDSKYMMETLQYSFAAESSVDPIIERLAKVLDESKNAEGGSDVEK